MDTLRDYNRKQLVADLISGVIVGVIALPLCIAFSIASGVSPEKGLYTAIIAGFLISALGGSRVQIGGPTGAFIVIVYGIVAQYGVQGLITATFLAGLMLIVFGLVRFGSIIKFIPHPLVVGFTAGIALVILSSQVKDFLGLTMGAVPADFYDKWLAYFENIQSINLYATGLAIGTFLITWFFPKISTKIPGSLVAIILATVVTQIFHLPVETIGSKYGAIPSTLPMPSLPTLDFSIIKHLIQPAFTIALLGGIESLLSAVVSDGMIGGSHRSNTELVAQGIANVFSSVFGGIPATGAIARTAANVKNGGRTPIAGIVHAFVLLLIMLFVGKWAALIPMACLAGILLVVSINMSEFKNVIAIMRGQKSDATILAITFLLTVFVDLTAAIEIGMVLSAFLFMRRMTQISNVENITDNFTDRKEEIDPLATRNFTIPKGVEVFEINGPMFFGATYKFKEAIKELQRTPKVLIIRMRYVPVIDSTGLHALEDIHKSMSAAGTKLVLSGVQEPVYRELQRSRLLFHIGKRNVTDHIEKALLRAQEILDA